MRCECGATGSRNERKRQIERDYCKQKRLKNGVSFITLYVKICNT